MYVCRTRVLIGIVACASIILQYCNILINQYDDNGIHTGTGTAYGHKINIATSSTRVHVYLHDMM